MASNISMYTAAFFGEKPICTNPCRTLSYENCSYCRSGLPIPRAIAAVTSVIDRSRWPSSSRVSLPEISNRS